MSSKNSIPLRRSRRTLFSLLLALAVMLGGVLPFQPNQALAAQPELPAFDAASAPTAALAAPAQAQAPQAPTDTIFLQVVSARTQLNADVGHDVQKGDPVTEYTFMINVDNTGDPFPVDDPNCYPFTDPPTDSIPNPNYPDLCKWPGIHTIAGWSPIYTQGTEADLSETTGLTLPAGKYLITVMADGFKVDGEHFSIPMEEPGLVQVQVHPLPLPSAKMEILVFDDKSLTNGQYDSPAENGLAGFRASLNDIAGEITVDLFGNPLCTIYEKDANGDVLLDGDGAPIIETPGQGCVSDENGIITIPNIGPIRYDVLVIPPDGETWIQTTTLEGSQGWDTWLQEGGTGLDNEFIVAGEPFPWTVFGFVQPSTADLPPTPDAGSVEGYVMKAEVYSPFQGGLPYQGDIWGGLMGSKIAGPITDAWLSLNDLQGGDTAIWVGQADAEGHFFIDNVPPGNYFLSYWDARQHHILDFVQVTVQPNQAKDIGIRMLTGWFAEWYGTVFHDYNENGKHDPGEPGVPDYVVVMRDRDNTEIDRMSIAAVTDGTGFYELPKGYPMTAWMVLEAFSERYRSTGITFQASNQPEETTVLGDGVDVGILPIIGQSGRLDWGVKFYEEGENGGIVGTVTYDTVRAEDDARYAGAEPWQPGIPDLQMLLFASVKDPVTGEFEFEADGSYKKGPLLATTTTEHFVRAKSCQPRDVDGKPISLAVYPDVSLGKDCLEGPAMGLQFDTEFATLPGNYGFTEIFNDPVTGEPLAEPQPLPLGDYLVEVVIPNDPVFNRPIYKLTTEESPNIFDGDTFTPQIPPPPCAGPMHTVDVLGDPPDGPNAVPNPGLVEAGGSRFEGMDKPLCNVKLISVTGGKSIAPIFSLYTDVPIPGRWKGYMVNDLDLSSNPFELFVGEKAGLPYLPIGVYDFTGRRVHTMYSDFHGVYEVLLPSDATYNAPTPSGMAANMYYIYGNDPGSAFYPDPYYNPQYRSIGTTFEIYPGVMVPSDLAPVRNGVGFQAPTTNVHQASVCRLDDAAPEIFTVTPPYLTKTANVPFTIVGENFGATRGDGRVRLGNFYLPTNSWSDTQIVARIPFYIPAGAHQLSVRNSVGEWTTTGLTMHLLGAGYQPTVYEVGPGKTYDASDTVLYDGLGRGPIQHAIDDAYTAGGNSLVVVYPGQPNDFTNQLGVYFENLILYSPVKLQGVGHGGIYPNGDVVRGTILDGRAVGGDTGYTDFWRGLAGDIWLNRGGWDGSPVDGDGNPRLYEGAVITVFAEDGEFTSGFNTAIDGFIITGGDQQGFPNNLNQIGGGQIPGVPAEVVVQGGGVFVNAYARYMRISNNLIQANGGAYAGGIRVGTPDEPVPYKDHQNDSLEIEYNRIIANGGTNLAGGIGLFAGAEDYLISNNQICGNFSAEYGGGVSHYGLSPNGEISNNRIYFNSSYDEGGGIMIAGELPVDPATMLSTGAGPVEIFNNLLQANLANDDGGGLRFLMAGDFLYQVYNNIVVNNVSTHEGGGISLNDAPNVHIFNNTIAKNLTTATAMTSDGFPAPAGLSSSAHSVLLKNTLPVSAPTFSNPVLFNNLFYDNRAGTWTGGGVAGIGLAGDPNPIYRWDLGLADNFGVLEPVYSLLHVPYINPHPSNKIGLDPKFIAIYDTQIEVLPWRGNPNFIGANLIAVDVLPSEMGDYHLQTTSPAVDVGIGSWDGVLAPSFDIDLNPRPLPYGAYYDVGADEIFRPFPAGLMNLQAASLSATELAETTQFVMPQAAHMVFLPSLMNPGSGQAEWGGQTTSFDFSSGDVQVLSSGYAYWNTGFEADQDAYLSFTNIAQGAERQGLLLKVQGLTWDGEIGPNTRMLGVFFKPAGQGEPAGTVTLESYADGVWTEQAMFGGVELAPGDMLGARTTTRGLVEVFHNSDRLIVVDVTQTANPWNYTASGGRIGVMFDGLDFSADPAGFTGFGGGPVE